MVHASPLAADDGGGSPTSCSARVNSTPFARAYRATEPTLGVAEQLPMLIEEHLRGLLGGLLSGADRASVQLAPLRSCQRGEMVAVEGSDGELRYGQVVGEEAPGSGEVKVQVSKACIRWYALSQIRFFQSVGRTSGKQVDDGRAADREPLPLDEAGGSTLGVIAEVNTLLARLNVSLSTSYEELLAEILRLQHRAALADEDRRAAHRQLEQALSQKRDAEKALVCVVCLVNAVDRVLVPCGHSYCSTCVERLHRDLCPVCRREVADSAAFRVS